MKMSKLLVGAAGVSFTVFALWSVLAPAGDAGIAPEKGTGIALASAPFVLRDGRQAVADVVRVAFEPRAVSLPEGAQEPLQALLDGMADGCILSAQVVGAASEYETAPRPVVDAHQLALERADAIAKLVRASGVPPTAVASVWTVDSGLDVPHSILWVFSGARGSACVEPTTAYELAAVPVESAADTGPARATSVAPPVRRTERDRSALAGPVATEVPPAAPAREAELTLTFADNSSYLDDQDVARLRRFVSGLGPACAVTLRATVAGGANAHYAAWLAERRVARVADQLGELATVEAQTFVPDDASRQVVVAIGDRSTCSGTTETTSAMNTRL